MHERQALTTILRLQRKKGMHRPTALTTKLLSIFTEQYLKKSRAKVNIMSEFTPPR